jgi:hypothetical protein
VLSLKSNGLKAEGGKALAGGLKGNNVITELNIAYNDLVRNAQWKSDMSGVIALANTIKDMGALSKFTFGDSYPVTIETSLMEANFSGRCFGVSEAIMLSAFLPKCMYVLAPIKCIHTPYLISSPTTGHWPILFTQSKWEL